ncbi:MAG: GNAT family N-acetyltransferase [Chromatiaceae bacterium]
MAFSTMDEIEFEFTLRPDPDPTLGRYVLAFEGRASGWDDTIGDERQIGNIRGHRVDLVTAVSDRLDQVELLESLTPEIADFSHVVLADSRCLLPSTAEEEPPTECDCLVYIAELWVEPEYRGRGIGTRFLQRLGATIDLNRCLIALKALPLREDHARVSTDEEVERVKRFYEQIGFERAGGDYMIKDARHCEAMKKRLAGRRPL